MGKTDNFKNGYVGLDTVPVVSRGEIIGRREMAIGDYLAVKVESAGPRALQCRPIAIANMLTDFHQYPQLFHTPCQQ